MRLSDVMSNLNLSIYPIIGMLLFLSVFVGTVIMVTQRKRRAEFDLAARLPLADENTRPETRS
jgi:cbb3-type cytochrome oxidase subunit 3